MTLEQRLSHPVSRPSDPAGLELRHLVALRAVAECGTFARAADCLGYTQSAVSQQVAALERVLGQKVFDRPGGPRPVVLTPSGRLLLERGEEILDRVAVTMADLAQVHDSERGRIRLGSFQSVSVHLAPPLLARLRAERPLVEVGSQAVRERQRRRARAPVAFRSARRHVPGCATRTGARRCGRHRALRGPGSRGGAARRAGRPGCSSVAARASDDRQPFEPV